MNTKTLPSLEILNSFPNTFKKGGSKTEHGNRFEDIVCKVFGFYDDNGKLWQQYGKPVVDVPEEIVKNGSVHPKYHMDWSIKFQEERKSIGYATARRVRDHQATKPMVHCVAFWGYRKYGAKKIVGFNYSIVTPSQAN